MLKKGVSPLIATVLLIAFSVALGAVVMNWGRGFITKQTEDVEGTTSIQLKCSVDILLDFLEIGDVKQACYDATSGYMAFTIENKGSQNITGISVQVVTTADAVYVNETMGTLVAGGAQRYTIYYGTTDPVKYLGVSPIIEKPGSTQNQICVNNKLELSEPEAC